MSGTHNKLQHGKNFNHWKFSDFVVDLNCFYFSHPNPNHNLTHLPKHEFPSPNNQFCHRIWYVEYYSGHEHMMWSQKFCKSEISLDTGVPEWIPAGVCILGWSRSWSQHFRFEPEQEPEPESTLKSAQE